MMFALVRAWLPLLPVTSACLAGSVEYQENPTDTAGCSNSSHSSGVTRTRLDLDVRVQPDAERVPGQGGHVKVQGGFPADELDDFHADATAWSMRRRQSSGVIVPRPPPGPLSE